VCAIYLCDQRLAQPQPCFPSRDFLFPLTREKVLLLPTGFPISSQAGNISRNAWDNVVVEACTISLQISNLGLMRLRPAIRSAIIG
jgi:hypothetical protein